jgi:nucleotide-binding universal stress UspA family protein
MPVPMASLRLTFKNVLFPTDFSDASKGALPYALAIARLYGSKVFVTHAVAPEPPLAIPLEPVPIEMDPLWQDARRNMSRFLETGSIRETTREGILEQGDLWAVLDDVIHRHSIDLIVLGSHGRHGIKKLVLGSAAEQIFRRARCPVMTVGPRAVERAPAFQTYRHIVFATDFSPGSLHALPFALSLAEETQAQLTLAHLIPLVPMLHQEQVREQGLQRLRELIPAEAECWCKPEVVVRFEFPAEGLLKLAAEREADLIVMGVHSRTPRTSAHLPWAIAYEVVCHASCPVLTVRE